MTSSRPDCARLDKWLWAVRLFKTRALATDACRAGSIELNGQPTKPAREVRPGDVVKFKHGLVVRTLRVEAAPRSRVAAKLVPQFCTDLTPAEEFEKARRHRVQQFLGAGKRLGSAHQT